MKVITIEEYFDDCQKLVTLLSSSHVFDCIIALKRSGWILGALLSNKLNTPVFTESEVKSIPEKFKSILIVDDKVSSGKSINRVVNQCKLINILSIQTACLYVQEEYVTDFYIKKTGNQRIKPFYELCTKLQENN